MFKNGLPDIEDAALVTTVFTKNGEETRPIENLARLVNFRGVPEYVREPRLRPGEEMFRTHDGDCIIVEMEPTPRTAVVGLHYQWDSHAVRRTLIYSDGSTSVDHVSEMPSKAEFQAEKEMYSRWAGVETNGKV